MHFSLRFQRVILLATILAFCRTSLASPATDRVRELLESMGAWVGGDENGRLWHAHLKTDWLTAELPKEKAANPARIDAVLDRYRSGVIGLDLPRFAAVREAIETWRKELDPHASDPLVTVIESARGQFVPIPTQQIDRARQRVVEQVGQLDRYLTPGGANGQAWKEYLKWEELSTLLAGDPPPNLKELSSVFRKYRANHVGLEMPVFADTAQALEAYIDALTVARLGDDGEAFNRQIGLLATDVEKYLDAPAARTAYLIGQRLSFMEKVGRSPHVLSAVRQRLSRQNLVLGVGTSFLNASVTQPPAEPQPLTDVILGTSISGWATPYSSIQVRTIPNPSRAHLRLVLSGIVHSNTVGANGPVCIYATGRTPFCATKDVFLTDQSMVQRRSVATADTRTEIHDIVPQRRFASRLIERIAWKRAGQQKGQAEVVASRRAEQRITSQFDRQFDEQSGPQLASTRSNLDKNLRTPLARYGEKLEDVVLSTTQSHLGVALRFASRSQLAADGQPPRIGGRHDLTARVHESFPNNLASTFVAGFKLTDSWLREKAVEIKGELPPELQEEGQDPWSITFAQVLPVTTVFAENGFTVTIRGEKYTSGDREFSAMNITAKYQFETRPDGIVLVRQGELTILPPKFDPAVDKLSTQDVALIEILVNRLAKLFKPEIPAEGIELPGEMKKLGRLFASELSSSDGWLAIGWRREAGTTAHSAVPDPVAIQ